MEVSKVKQKTKTVDPKLIPNFNIGMIGHVAHGKTSLTEALTGKRTLTHSEELKRGITIRLGYADASIFKCAGCAKYFSTDVESATENSKMKCPYCFGDSELVRTISFVDAPGHETLMATVLTGAALMNGAILIIAANERCPQPQTREHLTALEVVGIKNVIIMQNKIDLVDEKRAKQSYAEIKKFVAGTALEKAPVIPISAQQRINIDIVVEAIEKLMKPDDVKENEGKLRMLIARSFDVNKPGTRPAKLSGGILGGGIVRGRVKVGDEIEMIPGIRIGNNYRKLTTRVLGLQKAGIDLEEVGQGGLIGMLTSLDPSLTKSDSLVGNVVGLPGELPEAKDQVSLEVKLLERVVGSKEMVNVAPIKVGESLMINSGTARSVGPVNSFKKSKLELSLKIPICAEGGQRVTISRMISGRWRLIGYGTIL